MELNMTKSAKKLLALTYRDYLDRQKNGIPKRQAKYFSAIDTMKNHFPDMPTADYKEIALEMCHATGSKYYSGGSFELSDNAIVYMENRFADGAKSLAEFIAQLI